MDTQATIQALLNQLNTVIVGKPAQIQDSVACLLAGGHLLIEDVPGVGKTTLAHALARSFGLAFARVQFTSDLMPSDLTGVAVYERGKEAFVFHPGPVFTQVLLADEINRASPKTQSALLEVMEEGRVTIDGVSRAVGVPFVVIATQNPVEQAGTYRLPEAQLDRFLLKASLGYPDHAATLRILDGGARPADQLEAVITPKALIAMADLAKDVYANALVLDYIARIVDASRSAEQVRLGVSIRGALALTRASRTRAASQGRTYATPDDVKALAIPVLAHRLILHPEAEFDGVTADAVIGQVLLDVPPPTQRETA